MKANPSIPGFDQGRHADSKFRSGENGGVFRRPPAKEVWQEQAAELVGIVLSGEFESYDDNSEDAMVDFMGQTSIGSVALEVTSTVDQHMFSLSRDVQPSVGFADHLRYEWSLRMPWSISRPSKNFLPNLLATLEELEPSLSAEHLDLFGDALGREEEAASPHAWAIRRLQGLGFADGSARRAEAGWPGGIHIGFGGFMPSGDPILAVTEALESNCDKLLKTPAQERHLFVWVHETNLAMTIRLLLNLGPNEAIDLCGIDQVWVAPWQENTAIAFPLARTWVQHAKGAWHQVERPTTIPT
ncbi:MAG: hypothetical protein WCF25_02845 [Acidimicrobiales bacterium]